MTKEWDREVCICDNNRPDIRKLLENAIWYWCFSWFANPITIPDGVARVLWMHVRITMQSQRFPNALVHFGHWKFVAVTIG